MVGVGVRATALVGPPVNKSINGKRRSVMREADEEPTAIRLEVVDPVRHSTSIRVASEVVVKHMPGRLLPGAPSVLEVADQLLLLRIDTENRESFSLEDLPLFLDVGGFWM